MEVIFGKMTIPTDTPLVPRSRLLEVLRDCLNSCNSTIINGRAGTGKTMLTADFVKRCGWPVAWYTVGAPDADLSVFLQYLVKSVAYVCPDFGAKTLEAQARPGAFLNFPKLAEAFLYDLQKLDGPLLFVIDDLHLVYDADWVVPFFHRLLPLLPTEVHLMILGRSLPPAPLWRLRSKQRLCVIDESALAFTQAEAETLFASYGLTVEQARAARRKTRGRAAAMHGEAIRLDAAPGIGRRRRGLLYLVA